MPSLEEEKQKERVERRWDEEKEVVRLLQLIFLRNADGKRLGCIAFQVFEQHQSSNSRCPRVLLLGRPGASQGWQVRLMTMIALTRGLSSRRKRPLLDPKYWSRAKFIKKHVASSNLLDNRIRRRLGRVHRALVPRRPLATKRPAGMSTSSSNISIRLRTNGNLLGVPAPRS